MVQIKEGKLAVDGAELYTKTWLPDGPTRAKLVFVHGFSDHINCYVDFFPRLADRGIATYGFDQRGWGRSVQKPADRGLTGNRDVVLQDLTTFLKPLLPQSDNDSDIPVFVMGHSMGGNEVATLMASPKDSPLEKDVVRRVRGWMLESPFFGWAKGEAPSTAKVVVGRLAGRLFPHMQLRHAIPAEYLSRDPAVVKRIQEDHLCHDTGTLEGLASVLDSTNDIASGKCPPGPAVANLWLGHGTDDLAASYEAAKTWFDNSAANVPDRTLRTYQGWVHQLHAEPTADRELFYQEVGDWILERSGNKEPQAGTLAPTTTAAALTEEESAAASAAAAVTVPELAPTTEESPAESKL